MWIHPFQISVVKGNALVAPLFTEDKLHPNGYDKLQWHDEITHASEEKSNMLHVEKISLFEFCNGKRDLKIYSLLKSAEPAHCPRLNQYGLKTLLSEGLSEPEFYGDLVYKLKKLIGINDFSFQFRKIITRYRRIGYNLNVMRQSACLVFNRIMVDNYAAFFNCTPVGRTSDSMMAPT